MLAKLIGSEGREMRPGLLFLLLWLVWAMSWIAAAVWQARTESGISPWQAWSYRLPILLGAVLLYHRTSDVLGAPRLWHVGYTGAYILLGVTATGLAFTWWARLHLGRLWSSGVTRKEGHHIVDTGPYSLVRHPIYTGLIVATLASASALATLVALLGFVLMTTGFWIKARMEERFLAEQLGSQPYAAYQRRVAMLVPYTRWRGC